MEKFVVSLSRNDIDLIVSCLSSCTSQCFSAGNVTLAKRYLDLYDRFQNILR